MATLARYARLYFLITAQYVKARLEYRTDFIISSFGILFQNGASFLTMLVLFRSIPALEGWSHDQLVFLYAFSVLAVTPAQLFFDHFWSLRNELQQGSFIKYYFRPLNSQFAFIADVVDLKGFAQLAFSLFLLVWSSLRIGFPWSPQAVGTLVLYFLGSSAAFAGVLMLASSSAFWITNSFAVISFFFRFRDYARWPVTIFDGALRLVFSTFIPLGFIATYPVQGLIAPATAGWVPWLTPLVGAAFFGASILVWNKGTRSWSGTGS
jgi:ABC-2 type transport system permease protein